MSRRTVRGFLRQLTPKFLSGWFGTRVIFTFALLQDAALLRVLEGIAARFPDRAPDDAALEAIGRDRGIIRGQDESAASFKSRLKLWLNDWRRAGHAYAIMSQIAGYLTPHAVKVRIVTNSGVWYTRDTSGTESRSASSPNNWDWDGDTANWSRFWVVIYPPAGGALWSTQTWNSGKWGDGNSLGMSSAGEAARTIRRIVQQWKPAHAECVAIVVSFDDAEFDPADAPAAPDGTWGTWHDKTTSAPVVASRLGTARYWEGA